MKKHYPLTEESDTICTYCPDSPNLPINIICTKCSRPLIEVNWVHFFIYLISICAAGFFIGYFKNIWLSSLFVEFVVFNLLIQILRKETSARITVIIPFLIIVPVILFISYGNLNSATQDILIYFLIAGMLVYLFIAFFITWQDTCSEFDTSELEGFSVVSLNIFLLIVMIDLIFNKFGKGFSEKKIVVSNLEFSLSKIIAILRASNRIRSVLLVATIIQVMFFALIYTVKRKISRPDSLFKSKIEIDIVSFSHRKPIIDILFKTAQAIINIVIHFSIVVAEIIKAVLNILKIVIEYIFKFLKNYSLEFFILIANLLKIFFKTNYYFLKKHAVPLLLIFVIIFQSNILLRSIFDYIQTSTLSYLGNTFFHIFALFLWVLFFVLIITNYKLIETVYSVVSSYIWVIFITFICVLISSWVLFTIAKAMPNLPYRQIGPFTIIGTSLLGLFVLVIFIGRLIKGEVFKK